MSGMSEQTIARLVGVLDFRVNTGGLEKFQQYLQRVSRQMKQVGSQANKLQEQLNLKLGINQGQAAKQWKATQAMTKQQFQAQMQMSKFTLATEKAKTQLAGEQVRQSTLQTRQALARGKLVEQHGKLNAQTNKAAQQHNMRAELHAQKMVRQQAMTAAAEARSRTAIGRAEAWAKGQRQKAQARTERAAQRAQFSGGGMSGSRLPHLGGAVSGGVRGLGSFAGRAASMTGGMAGFEGLTAFSGLAGAAGGATMALGALAVAVAAASVAFAGAAERSANVRDLRMAQLRSMTGSDVGAQRADQHFRDLADKLGISVGDNGRDYAKVTGSLAKKVGIDRAEATTGGILSYGKAQGMSSVEIGNMTRGILQALGKNQLYAEEWTGQIAEHMGANANLFGAEAWQRAKGGHATGDKAMREFSDDRQNKLIVGTRLTAFFENLGKILQQHANDGGALDVAINTQESRKNRTQNHVDALLQHAWDADDGKLNKSVAQYTTAKLALLDAMGPAFDKFGSMAASTLDLITRAMDTFTEFVHALSSTDSRFMEKFFDPAVMKTFKAAWSDLGGDMSHLFETLDGVWKRIFGDTSGADIFSAVLTGLTSIVTVVGDVASLIDSMINRLIAVLKAAGLIKAEPSDAKTQTNQQARDQTADRYGGSEDVPQTAAGLEKYLSGVPTIQTLPKPMTADSVYRSASDRAAQQANPTTTAPTTSSVINNNIASPHVSVVNNISVPTGTSTEGLADLIDQKSRQNVREEVHKVLSEFQPKEVH